MGQCSMWCHVWCDVESLAISLLFETPSKLPAKKAGTCGCVVLYNMVWCNVVSFRHIVLCGACGGVVSPTCAVYNPRDIRR